MTHNQITSLVLALNGATYRTTNGMVWRFSFEYPGCFTWSNGSIAIHATPDHDVVGEIAIERDDLLGRSEGLGVVAYTAPLTTDAYIMLVTDYLDAESAK